MPRDAGAFQESIDESPEKETVQNEKNLPS